MNNTNNPTYFQILKTLQNSIPGDFISNRLIITDKGEVYFDWDENIRIPISTSAGSSLYLYNDEFDNVSKNDEDNTIIIKSETLKSINGGVTEVRDYGLVVDISGNLGVIIEVNKGVDSSDSSCTVKVLSSIDDSIDKYIKNNHSIIRYEYVEN